MPKRNMKTHTKIVLGLGGAAVLVGGLAFAGSQVLASGWEGGHKRGGMGRGIQMFEQMDANGDSRVTAAEITAFADALRTEHDTDGNNAISLSEFEGIWLKQMRSRMVDRFQMMDDDGDGEISEAEVNTKMSRMMRRMDRNDDGAIELKELGRHKRHGKYHDGDDDDDDDKDRS